MGRIKLMTISYSAPNGTLLASHYSVMRFAFLVAIKSARVDLCRQSCGGFRTDPHLRFFYSNSDQFCVRFCQLAHRSSSSTPSKAQVVSSPDFRVSKNLGNWNLQNINPFSSSASLSQRHQSRTRGNSFFWRKQFLVPIICTNLGRLNTSTSPQRK